MITKKYPNGKITIDAAAFPHMAQEAIDTAVFNCQPVAAAVAKLREYEEQKRNTGLKDNNGKPILEGDIVKYDDYIFVVKYGKCGGCANNPNYGYIGFYLDGADYHTKRQMHYGLRDDICYFKDIEVIGNIHDNPELLEVEA